MRTAVDRLRPSGPRWTIGPATSAADEQAWNDEQLATPVREPALRLWNHERPAIVIGRSRQRIDMHGCCCRCAILDRASGGGAVFAGPWFVSVSVALPLNHPVAAHGILGSYRWLGEAHARALRRVGIESTALSPDEVRTLNNEAPSTVPWACFGSLSAWEVVGRDGRKLVGLAQVRRRSGVLLVAGTAVQPPDWIVFAAMMGRPRAEGERLAALATDCASEIGQPLMPGTVGDAIRGELHAALCSPPLTGAKSAR